METKKLLILSKLIQSEEQVKAGSSFTLEQQTFLQNALIDLSNEVINKTFEYHTTEPNKYGVELAYLQGQMNVIQWLLELSEVANNFSIPSNIEEI